MKLQRLFRRDELSSTFHQGRFRALHTGSCRAEGLDRFINVRPGDHLVGSELLRAMVIAAGQLQNGHGVGLVGVQPFHTSLAGSDVGFFNLDLMF
jgi:hypothetical protein